MKTQDLNYFYINNIKINNVEKNRNIIDYLENLGIKVPHYCYHQKLSVSGNCRMCLVELKNSPKPVVSCAMTVTNKMEIFTESPLVKKARENIMEFLLLNHPLDCPICDQGGECDLQDQSVVFGTSKKRFFNYKRSVLNKNLGPIVKTVMTRCIHCTKCVRFATEIAGVDDLGVFGRGYASEIGTYVSKIFNSELSGNVIDVCPVGALTTKPYSFVDRNWELTNVTSIDFSDGFGSDILISVKSESIVTKIQPAYKKADLSNSWISDKTRFSFDGMFSSERITSILIKNVEKTTTIKSWEIILKEIVNTLYFENLLAKHKFSKNNLKILIENSISIELVNLLLLLEKNYSFVVINVLGKRPVSADHEKTLSTLNFEKNSNYLDTSTLCILVNINTKYESSSLNLKLRQRFLKGNFKIYSINSLIDLTIPTFCLGSTINSLKKISTGSHALCVELKKAKNPIIIYNNDFFFQKQQTDFIIKVLLNIEKNLKLKNSSLLNMVHSTLSSSTSTYFNCFNAFNECGNSNLLCLNVNFNNILLKKIVELTFLNYIVKNASNIIINQNYLNNSDFSNIQSTTQICLPNKTLLETDLTFLNTEGNYKKNVKAITFNSKNKSSEDVIIKLNFLLNKTQKYNSKNTISLDANNKFLILKYSNLHYISIPSFKTTTKECLFKRHKDFSQVVDSVFSLKTKFNHNKLNLWLDDFYLGGKDLYSKHSKVMIECSKSIRTNSTNFKFII